MDGKFFESMNSFVGDLQNRICDEIELIDGEAAVIDVLRSPRDWVTA